MDAVRGLPEQVRMSREFALMGNYSAASIYFEGVVATITQYVKTLSDPYAKQKWMKMKDEIAAEARLVNDLNNELNGLKEPPGKAASRAPVHSAHSAPPPNNDVFDNFANNYVAGGGGYHNEPAPSNPFGNPYDRDPDVWPPPTPPESNFVVRQPPINPSRRVSQGANKRGGRDGRDMGNQYGNNNNGGYGNNNNGGYGNNNRDNNVGYGNPNWNPPPLRARSSSVPKKQAPNAPSTSAGSKPNQRGGGGGGGGGAAGRNYDKPWQQPMPPTPPPASQGENGGRKSFAQHVYGDRNGEGPDSELINMLEREVIDKAPQVKFDDIADLDDAKRLLEEAVVLPLLMPDYFQGIRRPWRGILMFGPPGTGKTTLAKAVATQCGTTFFNVSASSLASKWRGDSEKLVRLLFEMARFYAPTTIFFDEIDALVSKRGEGGEHESSRRVKSEMLTQMEGVSTASTQNENGETEPPKLVLVLAATNRPWDLDEALRRRLEKRIYIPLPTEKGRQELFKIALKGIELDADVDFDDLVGKTDGFSGADINNLCRDAAMMPMRAALAEARQQGGLDIAKLKEDMKSIPLKHADFLKALKGTNRSVGKDDLQNYSNWFAEFGSV
eukprot:GILJ01008943.1.p1 GENE.GILJ01008943.1~~GILJ01008943.1.p1  ORF type:complete len:612 (-),score=121.33 GILJ01008943.1:230-2065(-)